MSVIKDIPSYVKDMFKKDIVFFEKKCAHGKWSIIRSKILKERVEELEQVLNDKSSGEKKMQNVIKELEKVVKAMTHKVIHLEEQIVKIKEDSKAMTNNDVKESFEDASDYKSSTPVSAKEKPSGGVESKPIKSKKDKFKCDNCEYMCQKE